MILADPDWLSDGDRHLPLLVHPLEDYFRTTGKPSPFGYKFGYPARREYGATWLIENGGLYLVDVRVHPWPEDSRLPLAVVFPNLSPPIKASWFSGTLRIGHGDVLKDDVVSPVYEREQHVIVHLGRITASEFLDGFTVLSRQEQASGARYRQTAGRFARITTVIVGLVTAGALAHVPRLILAALLLVAAATGILALGTLRIATWALRDAEWYQSRQGAQGSGSRRPVDPPSRESPLEAGAWLFVPGIVLLAFAAFAYTESSNVVSVTLVYVLHCVAFVFGLTGLVLGVAGCEETWKTLKGRNRDRQT